MGSKLSVHFQSLRWWIKAFMEQSGALYYKVMDVRDDPCPGKRAVFRLYRPDQETNEMVWRGAEGAGDWLAWALPELDARRWAWAVEDINEGQPMNNRDFRKNYNEFTVAVNEGLRREGFRHVGLNFGVGWPDWGHGRDFADAFEVIDYWGPHEYNAPSMAVAAPNGRRCWVGRYQETKKSLQKAGIRVPPIFFGEYGIDRGVWTPENPTPLREHGWQSINNHPAWYADELRWADRTILMPDRDVKAAFVYTAGPGEPWAKGGFEVTEDLAINYLVPHMRSHPPAGSGHEYGWDPAPEIVDIIDRLPRKNYGQFQERDVTKLKLAIIHHTGGNKRAMRRAKAKPVRFIESCARWHISHYKRDGVLYHFMVAENGTIFQTQPVRLSLAHHAGDPDVTETSVSCCFLGNKNKERPSDAQLKSMRKLLIWVGLPVKLHSQIVPTSCPAGRRAWGKRFVREVNRANL